MKKLVVLLLLVSSWANAYEIYQGPPAGKFSDTVVLVSPTGVTQLQQDTIDSVTVGTSTRHFGYVFGRNLAVQNVLCDLWEGPTCTYVFPTVAQQMRFVSTSAADAAAGTGVQQIHIHYLDASYNEQQETITLNGVTPVNSVATNILRINSLHAYRVGTGGVSAGNISMTNLANTVTYAFMAAGYNTARQAIYTIPAAHNGYVSHWQASSGTTTGTHFTRIMIRATAHVGVLLPGVFLVVDEVGTLNGGTNITLPIPVRMPAATDVKMSAVSDAANANAVAMGTIMGWFENQ